MCVMLVMRIVIVVITITIFSFMICACKDYHTREYIDKKTKRGDWQEAKLKTQRLPRQRLQGKRGR